MYAGSDLAQALAAVIGDIAAAAGTLERVLDEEHAALQAGDMPGLDRASAAKERQLRRLDVLDHERQHLVAQLAERGETPAATASRDWKTALATLETCARRNRDNGALVQTRLGFVRLALEALGETPPPPIYDPRGRHTCMPPPRPLARA